MTAMNPGDAESAEQASLPRRDWILLPLLSVLTIVVLVAVAEIAARTAFTSKEVDSCQISDALSGFKYRPNCTARLKLAEGPWVTNRYNECGYRTKDSCRQKPEGSTRIALIGSSVSEGLFVDDDQTIAAQTARDLTRTLHRPVEFQNLGRVGCIPICTLHVVDEALALRPDLLMMALTPSDLALWDPTEAPDRTPLFQKPPGRSSLIERAQARLKDDPAVQGAMFYLIENNPDYVTSRLNLFLHKEASSGFLKAQFSPGWEKRFAALDQVLAEIELKCRKAKVPFVLFEVPAMQQLQLARMPRAPTGVQADAFDVRLKQIAAKNGISYIDTMDGFTAAPDPSKIFYVLNTHMNGQGYAIVSRTLAEQLTKEHIPELTGEGEGPRPETEEQKR